MAIRTYTGVDVINVDVSQSGNITGSTVNRGAHCSSSGNGSIDSAIYAAYFKLDFTVFPSIPIDAAITRVHCFVDNHQVVDATTVAGTASTEAIGILYQVQLPATVLQSAVLNTSFVAPPNSNQIVDQRLEWTIDYDPPISRSDLMNEFGFFGGTYPTSGKLLLIQPAADTNVITDGTANADSTFSNWTFEVTYTSGPFSWYLETHQSTISGQPATIVDDAVQVLDGDTPPIGSTFYGTGDDFPDGPIYHDYYYPPTGDILNQPISPGLAWLLQFVNFSADLRFDFATESRTVALIDPSGIYTLVEGKTHDTLYERTTIDHQDVKIPDPFGKTGYVP